MVDDFRGYVYLRNLLMSYHVRTLSEAGFEILLGITLIFIPFATVDDGRWMASILPFIGIALLLITFVSSLVFNRYKRDAIRLENLRPNDN